MPSKKSNFSPNEMRQRGANIRQIAKQLGVGVGRLRGFWSYISESL